MKIKYKKLTVEVPGEKPKKCSCCGNTPKPRGMNIHHTKYAYTVKEVKVNPILALKNTIWLCYFCHRLANCIRIIEENPSKVKKLHEINSNRPT